MMRISYRPYLFNFSNEYASICVICNITNISSKVELQLRWWTKATSLHLHNNIICVQFDKQRRKYSRLFLHNNIVCV